MAIVKVPQENDEIVISQNGETVVRATVTDHMVEIPDDRVALVIQMIPGAELVETPSEPVRAAQSDTQDEAKPAAKETK